MTDDDDYDDALGDHSVSCIRLVKIFILSVAFLERTPTASISVRPSFRQIFFLFPEPARYGLGTQLAARLKYHWLKTKRGSCKDI